MLWKVGDSFFNPANIVLVEPTSDPDEITVRFNTGECRNIGKEASHDLLFWLNHVSVDCAGARVETKTCIREAIERVTKAEGPAPTPMPPAPPAPPL